MLDKLRSSAGSWVAKIFIALLAMSFAVWGINDVFRGYGSDVLAQVGDRAISTDEYRQTFDRQLRAYSRRIGQTVSAEQARQIGLDRQILGELMQQAALESQAQSMRLSVADSTVADRIASNSAFQNSRGEFKPDEFRRLLQANGLSEQEFVASERRGMEREAVLGAVDQGLEPPAPLVEAIWRHRNEQRDARYFVVKADPSRIPEPSDQEVKEFYDKNQRLFAIPERRSFAVLIADPATLGEGIDVTEEEITAAFEKTKDAYGEPERRVLQQIPFPNAEEARKGLDKIRGGQRFEDLAKERGLSEADMNLGERSRSQIPDPVLAEAAFKLQQGELSEPVQGKLAVVLLRVTKVTPATQKSLQDVRDDVIRKARQEKGRDEVLTAHDKVEDGRAGGKSFEDIAKEVGLKLIVIDEVDSSGIGKDGKPMADVPVKDEVLRTAFESDVGVENDSIATREDGYVWADVREVTPASVKPLADVRNEAVAGWKKLKLREAALGKANDLRKRAESGSSLDQLARDNGAEVKTVNGLKRNEANEAIDRAAVSALFMTPANGFAVAPEPDGSGAKLMQSSPVLGPPFDPNSEDAKAIMKALAANIGGDLYAQYLGGLQESLGVKLNEALWSRLAGGS